jgi:uncharacterized iron-regulated membrane protein
MVVAVPFLIVLVTGLLLQLKKEIPWVQPPTQRGSGKVPMISMAQLLDAARTRPEAGITDWADIQRIDLQPRRGMAKVLSTSSWEVQIDLKTAEVLQVAYRRSDLIEALHDGSWFHESAKLYIFLPAAGIVLILWLTGMYLFALPYGVRWRRSREKRSTSGGAA